ncbi:MAG: hypothetical protein HGB14_08250 [Anaerolineaceae bacterium]|nr:hypothetical protein [Anaerolineaceae bacterium]
MSTIPVSELTQSIIDLLMEAYQGPPDANTPTWFNDNDPNGGVFGLISPLSAQEASTSADASGNPGTTVASHVEHLRWSLANANGALRGDPYQSNWTESWKMISVDSAEWNLLRLTLQTEVKTICNAIQKQENLEGPFLNGLLALVPHAAYHLATIRQIIERVKEKK